MKREVPFDLFEKGQTLYFDIARLGKFEEAMGDSLINIVFVKNMDNSISFCLNGLRVGLAHHYGNRTNDFYAEKIGDYLRKGGKLVDVVMLIGKAIMASGIFGGIEEPKEENSAEEKNEQSPLLQ